MIALLTRLARALAAAFSAFADSLSRSPEQIVDAPPTFAPGEQLKLAQAMASEIRLRGYLLTAMKRFSPEQPPIEA